MTSELDASPILPRKLLGKSVVLFRDSGNIIRALEDRCCHRAAPLSFGEVTSKGIQCGYHGLVFAGDGACVHIPGQSNIPPQARVESYPIIEHDGFAWIWMGEPEKAAIDLLVAFPPKIDVEWNRAQLMLPAKAGYELLLENLMDLTHLAFLHKSSIGGYDPDAHANAKMEITSTPTGVRFLRWMRNAPPGPGHVKRFGFAGLVDRWQEFEFVEPSSVVQFTGARDAGTDADSAKEDGRQFDRLMHTFTPETETSCFYFLHVAYQGTHEEGQKRLEFLRGVLLEDIMMVDGQQARMTEHPDGLVNIRSDVARIRLERHLQKLFDKDREASHAAE